MAVNSGYAMVCGRMPALKKHTTKPPKVSAALSRADAPRARHASHRNQNAAPTRAPWNVATAAQPPARYTRANRTCAPHC